MTLFNQHLTKNLILLFVILVITGLLGLVLMANQAQAASSQVKQVKTAASPTVYYLDYNLGVKKAYASAAAFLSYGNKWSDVKTISQAQLNKWPDLKLIKLAGEKNIYYIKGNKKAMIKSPSDLSSLGLNFGQVAQISQKDFFAYQTTDYAGVGLATAIASATKVKSGGGNPGILTVTLDPSNQPSGFLPMNSSHNLVAIYNFRAGGSPVTVRTITVNVRGVYKEEVVEKIYLTNEADYILGEPTTLNDRRAMFNFGADSFIIPAGETKKIRVYVDLKSYTDFVNNSLRVELSNLTSLQANTEVSGNFPLTAGEYKLAVGSLSGHAKIEEIAVNSGNKLIIGNNERIISKFKISETSGRENMVIKKITLVNAGTARLTGLANFKFKDSNNNLIAQSIGAEDNMVIFNINNYVLNKGQNKTFLLLTDVTNGEDGTVNFNLRDFLATGETYGYGLTFNQTNNGETFTIIRQPLNILSRELNPSKLVFSKQSGAIVGNFQVRNNSLRIYLNGLNVILEKNSSAPNFGDTVYLVNYDSGEVYSSTNGAKLLNGANFSFNGITLAPGQVMNFSLITNLPASARDGDKYRIIINALSYKYDNSFDFQDSPALGGNYLTVTRSSLYLYPNNDNWDKNYIKGQAGVKIASFIMEAAAGDDLNINQITLSKSGDTSGSVLYANGFSNLRLYIGGSQVGKAIELPAVANYVFDNFSYNLKAGSRVELKLYADTATALQVSETQLMVASFAAKSKKSQVASAIFGVNTASQKVYFGETKLELKALDGGSFVPGVKDNNVGSFSIVNSGVEDIRLKSLNIITTSDGFSYSLGLSNLMIVEASELKRVGAISRPVAGANLVNLSNYIIKSGQTVEFIIRVSASNTALVSSFEIYLSELKVLGKKSGLSAGVQGDPTDKIAVNDTYLPSDNGSSQVSVVRLAWPVDSRKINYIFYDPSYPFRGTAEHNGIDIEIEQGTPVKAAAAGVVVDAINNQNDQYNYVTIEHSNGLRTTYGHLSEVRVSLSDLVTSGQIIGLSGGLPGSIGSGQDTNGPHLHFGVNQNGSDVDPMGFLN